MNFKSDYILEKYMNDIKKYSLLTPEREKELSRIIHTSKDSESVSQARNEMVEGNLRMVVKLAAELYERVKRMEDINVSLMDLVQAGNIGLVRAAELFSYQKNFKFCSYAYPSIIRKMKKALKASHFIRIPFFHFKHISRLKSMENRIDFKDLTDDFIKKELDIRDEMFEMIKREKSSKVNFDDLDVKIESYIDEDETSLSKKIENKYLKNYLYEKMQKLNPFYRDVLFYKFFGNQDFTLKQIADKYGVTKERARQAIRSALKKLRIKISEDQAMSNLKLKGKKNEGKPYENK